MNRKKKINQILKAKQKKHNAKLHKSNKPRYISKAERAKMEAEEQNQASETHGKRCRHSADRSSLKEKPLQAAFLIFGAS